MTIKQILIGSFVFAQFSHGQVVKKVKIHNDLTTALEQVDTDGESLKITKSGKLLEFITKNADEYLVPELMKKSHFPAGFSFVKILDMSGLSEITASSQSVKKDNRSNYVSKMFLQTNGSRKGIFSLLGKADKPWASLEYAPENTALLLETHLDLTSVPKIMRLIAPMFERRDTKKILKFLDEKDPIAGNTVELLMMQANARISIIAEMDKNKTWMMEGQKLPIIHSTGRIDGIAKFLWKNYGKAISHNIPVKSVGNVHTIVSPQAIPAPWGSLTPVVVIDTDKNHIWVSLSTKHLKACKSAKTRLKNNKNYQLVNKHNRNKGAARMYLSKGLIMKALDLIETNMTKHLKEPQAEKGYREFIKHMKSFGSISSCLSHDDKGMLLVANTPFPLKHNPLGYVSGVSMLAGLSYAPILRHTQNAKYTMEISQLKNVYVSLLGYMGANNNMFPNNLEELVKNGHLSSKYLNFENRKLTYVKGLTPADSHKIILYTSADIRGYVIVARVDGSVKRMLSKDLQKILKKK